MQRRKGCFCLCVCVVNGWEMRKGGEEKSEVPLVREQ